MPQDDYVKVLNALKRVTSLMHHFALCFYTVAYKYILERYSHESNMQREATSFLLIYFHKMKVASKEDIVCELLQQVNDAADSFLV